MMGVTPGLPRLVPRSTTAIVPGLLAALVLLGGCTFGEDRPDASPGDANRVDAGDSGMDAGEMDAGEGPRVEVGTGYLEFEPLMEGQTVDLVSGPQGGGRYDGFHVWFGARTWEMNPEQISVTFRLLAASDRSELANLVWTTNFRPGKYGAQEIWGATPTISDCCLARSTPLVMRVEVADQDGRTAEAEIEVMGGPRCETFGMSVCP